MAVSSEGLSVEGILSTNQSDSVITKPTIQIQSKLRLPKRFWNAYNRARTQEIFLNAFPDIMGGNDLATMIDWDRSKDFFSGWYSESNLPLILKNLTDFSSQDLDYILQTLSSYDFEMKQSETLNQLMNGSRIVDKSPITSILKRMALELQQLLEIDKDFLYKIGFILTLPPAQRFKFLNQFLEELDFLDREVFLNLVDYINKKLVNSITSYMNES